MERGIFKWPALERIVRARFRGPAPKCAPRQTIYRYRPCFRILGVEDEPGTVLENWAKKRKFMEEQRGEAKSVE